MSSIEIFDLLEKASSLLNNNDVSAFKQNFTEIKQVIKTIPGHEDLVNSLNDIDKLDDWQITELKNTLFEQLAKTKQMWQQLKNTGAIEK